jgi:hypothetical protein
MCDARRDGAPKLNFDATVVVHSPGSRIVTCILTAAYFIVEQKLEQRLDEDRIWMISTKSESAHDLLLDKFPNASTHAIAKIAPVQRI